MVVVYLTDSSLESAKVMLCRSWLRDAVKLHLELDVCIKDCNSEEGDEVKIFTKKHYVLRSWTKVRQTSLDRMSKIHYMWNVTAMVSSLKNRFSLVNRSEIGLGGRYCSAFTLCIVGT